MYDVITIGSAVYDVFLLSDRFQLLRSEAFEGGVGECVPLGGKIDVDQKIESSGGGATNAAVTFARLGFSTACICRVGDDLYGPGIVTDLGRESVDTTFIRHVPGGSTGFSALLTAAGGERSILTHRGVSADFTPADIPWDALHARWIYLTSLGGNIGLTERIATQAARAGAMIAWNPGRGELAAGLSAISATLAHTAVFQLNKEEAATLTHQDDPQDVRRVLVEHGLGGVLIITNGHKGTHTFFKEHAWHSNTTGVVSVSRTGAGDAFGSGVVAGLLKGLPLPEALALGTLNAESVIQQVGAKKGILKKWPGKAAMARVSIEVIE